MIMMNDEDENTRGVEVDCASLGELWRAARAVCPSLIIAFV